MDESERIRAIDACQNIYMVCGIGVEECDKERDRCFAKIPDKIYWPQSLHLIFKSSDVACRLKHAIIDKIENKINSHPYKWIKA